MVSKLFLSVSALVSLSLLSVEPVQYLFCHGVGGNQYQVRYYQAYGFLPESAVSFNFNDWHDDAYDRSKTALGQKPDIDVLEAQYNQLPKDGGKVILYGVSRGAATVINFMGARKPNTVAAVILESPFTHIDDVIHNMTAVSYVLPTNLIMKAVFPSFSPKGAQPTQFITQIPKDTPIALICSKKDKLVPYTSTEKLYRQLLASGRRHVYLLVLEDGQHANLCNQPKYKKFVEDFLTIYGLSSK